MGRHALGAEGGKQVTKTINVSVMTWHDKRTVKSWKAVPEETRYALSECSSVIML